MKKLACFLLLACSIQLAYGADESLPPGTVRRGTMANAQLISDAKSGVASKVATLGCTDLGNVDTYVTVLPYGPPNSRHWSELWIVTGCGKKYPVAIEFSSDGKDADWVIR